MQTFSLEKLSSHCVIYAGANALDCLTELSAGRSFIVSDKTVFGLYGNETVSRLPGCCIGSFLLPEGEDGKTPESLFSLLDAFAGAGLTKADRVVALGGGSVSDTAGLAAALYKRGIEIINVPTTLLAMTDAAIGGKTAVNLRAGKNLVGVVRQPSSVVCDPVFLKSLPERQLFSGMAEVIKYAVCGDTELYEELTDKDSFTEKMLIRSVADKALLVEKDEFDTYRRHILNFGHTCAHAIEKLSGYSLTHGEAVAIGMLIMLSGADSLGIEANGKKAAEKSVITPLLKKFGLPLSFDGFSAADIIRQAKNDKKIIGGKIEEIIAFYPAPAEIISMSFADFADIVTEGAKIIASV